MTTTSSSSLQVIRREAALHRDKGEGTVVDYHVFPEYEIHHNAIAPGTVQQWHRHEAIEETLVVVEGELEVRWRAQGELRVESLAIGDVVRVARSSHTIANVSERPARFLVFRLVLDGTDKRELIKGDKIPDG